MKYLDVLMTIDFLLSFVIMLLVVCNEYPVWVFIGAVAYGEWKSFYTKEQI